MNIPISDRQIQKKFKLTNLNVIVDAGDNFVSGWKLNSAQVVELTTTGDIGGG